MIGIQNIFADDDWPASKLWGWVSGWVAVVACVVGLGPSMAGYILKVFCVKNA